MAVNIPTPKPVRARLNFLAILLGSIVDIALSVTGAGPIFVLFARNAAALLLFGLAMTAVGGYVAAAVAGRRSLAHGLGVGILSTVIGLALKSLSGKDSSVQLPVLYEVLGYAFTVPAGVLGGWVRRRFWGERVAEHALQPGTYPNLTQATWLAVLVLLITATATAVTGLVVSLARRGSPPIIAWAPTVVVGVTVGYALIVAWAARKARAPVAEIFPIKVARVRVVWPIIATIIGAAILLSELNNAMLRALSFPKVRVHLSEIFVGIDDKLWVAAIYIALIVVVAPVAEELLFRGVILRGFLSRYSSRKAILVSAVLFGMFHVNPFQFVTATMLGVLFAWWRVKTGSLVLPLLGHALNNALALAVPRLPWVSASAVAGATVGQVLHPIWFDLTGVLLFLVGILQFMRVSVSVE